MAQITKAAMDAAIEQGKREASAMYTATISRLKAERDDLRLKLDAEIEAGKRSITNEIDKSKGGGWKSRPKTIAGVVVLAALAVWLVFFLAGKARAAEACVGSMMPPDVRLMCHSTGVWAYDSAAWDTVLPTGVKCSTPT